MRDRYRWRSRHPQVSLDAENDSTEGSLGDNLRASLPSPDAQAETQERSATVQKAVAALPEELRQPLILATYQELSRAEIAALLKCSVKAVETRIYRARQQLRVLLADRMPTP